MVKLRYIVLVLISLSPSIACLQSLQRLDYETFMEIVRKHHPLMYQANLQLDKADAKLLKARGGFDPSLTSSLDQKSFDNKNYFTRFQNVLKIPTWFGPDLKLGYDQNTGSFLDPSEGLPQNGLATGGISIPVGQGLFFDERRKTLEEAKLFRESSIVKQRQLINKVLFSASKAYLAWQLSNAKLEQQSEIILLARERFVNTRLSYINGDKPAIDTLEAFVNVRDREQVLAQFILEFEQAKQSLNNLLWMDGVIPVELDSFAVPDDLNPDQWVQEILDLRMNQSIVLAQNPEIQNLQIMDRGIQIEQRLARENLKPSIQVNFNPLFNVSNANQFLTYDTDDYKFGVDFYFPLFNRKNRGTLKLLDVERQELQFTTVVAKELLENDFRNLLVQESSLQDQLALLISNVENYTALLEAENLKFSIGESSLFLVNSRESKLVDATIKVLEYQKYLLESRLNLLLLTQTLSDQ